MSVHALSYNRSKIILSMQSETANKSYNSVVTFSTRNASVGCTLCYCLVSVRLLIRPFVCHMLMLRRNVITSDSVTTPNDSSGTLGLYANISDSSNDSPVTEVSYRRPTTEMLTAAK